MHRDPNNRSVKQDVYASGVLLYEVIVQQLPIPNDYNPLHGRFEDTEGLDKIIQKAIAPERSRYKSIAEMRLDLAAVSEKLNETPF